MVSGRLHAGEGVAQCDALVEGGEGAEFHPPSQGGLTDEQAGEGAAAVHVAVGEKPQFFELVGVEEVGLVDDEHDLAAAFVGFGGERVGGLRDQRGLVEAGDAAERADDRVVEAAGADGRVAQVDDGVPAGVQRRSARPGRRRSCRRRLRR